MNNIQKSSSQQRINLIRVVAIVAVLLLHAVLYAANDIVISDVGGLQILRGWVVTVYLCFGRVGVPLFIMLTGALLFAPSKKDEGIGVFFKKRFGRIGLPFLFWGIVYFIWDLYVENQVVTQAFVIDVVLRGPYITFWYLYMLAGLYLLTPMLRVMVANFTDKLFKYFLCLWFIGVALVPLINVVSSWQHQLDTNVFVIPLCVGYFVIGAYLGRVQIQRWILATLSILGIALTVLGTYIMATFAGGTIYLFQEYSSPTVILASISLFILLNSSYAPPQNITQPEKPSWKQRIMHTISENSLAIFLFHMIPLYLLKVGFFGFALNGNTVNSIIGVPIIAFLSLLLSLIVIIPLKKIPVIKKLVG
jgi:surface polysaccharide O-acyltransferase-like enzyme